MPALLLLVVLALPLLALVIHVSSTLYVKHSGPLSTADRLTATNNARVALTQLLIFAGVAAGLVFTARTYILARQTYFLARQTQLADRFAAAVGQLGDKESETVRAGGVYGLALLAGEANSYWGSVDQLLAALIRERARPNQPTRGDVLAALAVMGRPNRGTDGGVCRVDLSNAHLVGVNLSSKNLNHVNFCRCRLTDADLTDASMVESYLTDASLDGAELLAADLSRTDLSGASLRGANFHGANLTGACLEGTDLAGAVRLTRAQLETTSGTPAALP